MSGFSDLTRRQKQYPNATKLANQFEMSVKTAQRDIEFMHDRLNCPLVYDQSEKGYYYEDDTFSLPSLCISSEELSALLITHNMLRGISASYIGDELSLLTDKITSILKRHVVEEGIIDDAVSIQQVAHVPPPEEVIGTCWTDVSGESALHSPIARLQADNRRSGKSTLPPVSQHGHMAPCRLLPSAKRAS